MCIFHSLSPALCAHAIGFLALCAVLQIIPRYEESVMGYDRACVCPATSWDDAHTVQMPRKLPLSFKALPTSLYEGNLGGCVASHTCTHTQIHTHTDTHIHTPYFTASTTPLACSRAVELTTSYVYFGWHLSLLVIEFQNVCDRVGDIHLARPECKRSEKLEMLARWRRNV